MPSIRANVGDSASVGSMVTQSVGNTPKYDQFLYLSLVQASTTNNFRRQSASVPGTVSSDDGLGGGGTPVIDSPTAKKGSTQSSPTVKAEKA